MISGLPYKQAISEFVRKRGTLMTIDESSIHQDEAVIQLTKREVEVLRLILEGHSNKEVASILCCSKRTVDFHLARIYDKLQVSNRVQAMRRATMLGIILPDTG
jgi:DNA-binding CsgD family transcriptional regulator